MYDSTLKLNRFNSFNSILWIRARTISLSDESSSKKKNIHTLDTCYKLLFIDG